MSDFKAKMHQIQFRLGLCSRPCGGGCLHCSPKPPSCIKEPQRGGEGGREGNVSPLQGGIKGHSVTGKLFGCRNLFHLFTLPSSYSQQGLCNCLVSICLSVCPLRTPHATAAGLLLCTWWAGDGSNAAAAACECGQ